MASKQHFKSAKECLIEVKIQIGRMTCGLGRLGQSLCIPMDFKDAADECQGDLVDLLHENSRYNIPGVGKKIELSAKLLLQAAPKIMPYMPKFHRGLDRFDLLSELNDLAWWYDELAEMAKIVKW